MQTTRFSRAAIGAVITALLFTTMLAAEQRAEPAAAVTVSAASSLTDVLTQLLGDHGQDTSQVVRLNVGPSSWLARQIVDGAPADLFISADAAQMDIVETAGRVEPGTRIDLLSNELVVIAGGRAAARLHSIEELSAPRFRRIVLGDPAGVPVGVYAKAYLERRGVWDRVVSRVLPAVSARAALAVVQSGVAEAGIVFRTDASAVNDVSVILSVPATDAPAIVYPAALLRGPRLEAARAVLRYLESDAARRRFEAAGFAVLDPPRSSPPTRDSRPETGTLAPAPAEGVWSIAWFTILMASAATVVMVPPGLAIAWLLARRSFPAKTVVETIVALPLVMPPVATGFIMLRALGPRSGIGRALSQAGIEVLFTWKGVVLAMAVMAAPLMIRTARVGFEQAARRYEQVAETLGAGPVRVFFTISLPLAFRSVVAGALLGFSRALGEFGATIVVAGSIPGRTRTLAGGIFSAIETGRDDLALSLLGASIAIAFGATWVSNVLAGKQGHV